MPDLSFPVFVKAIASVSIEIIKVFGGLDRFPSYSFQIIGYSFQRYFLILNVAYVLLVSRTGKS